MKKNQSEQHWDILLSEIKVVINATKHCFSEESGKSLSSRIDAVDALTDVCEDSLNRILPLIVHRKTKTVKILTQQPSIMASPPQSAKFILYLLIPKINRDGMLGDLEEEYWDVYKEFGVGKARFFYWWQVFKSVWPLVSASVVKLIKLVLSGIVARFSAIK